VDRGPIADDILAQDYEVNIPKWFAESWVIYKQHWLAFSLFTLFVVAIACLPHVGGLISIPLTVGTFIAVSNKIRYNGLTGDLNYQHFFYGVLFTIPLMLLVLLKFVIVFVGFLLCIVPGLYAMLALSFAIPVFVEYYRHKIGIVGSMMLSMNVVNKHLLEVCLFLIVNALFMIAGIFCLGIGALVTFPMGMINITLAFKDMFGLDPAKEQEKACVLTC